MAVSQNEFRQTLGRFASGVTVVTSVAPSGLPIGVTVSAFSSVSLSPPLVLVCLDRDTMHLASYTEQDYFAINVLSRRQEDVSNAFAFVDSVPPFEKTPWSRGANGVPLIDGVVAAMQCTRQAVYDGGDHIILIGHVDDAHIDENSDPLVYFNGAYSGLTSEISK